jgi:hypothetical protein
MTWSALHTAIPTDARVVLMEPRGAQMLAATDHHGLFLSNEKRQEWKQIGGSLPDVKITALHVADGEIYAGVYRQGIFATIYVFDLFITIHSWRHIVAACRLKKFLVISKSLVSI